MSLELVNALVINIGKEPPGSCKDEQKNGGETMSKIKSNYAIYLRFTFQQS